MSIWCGRQALSGSQLQYQRTNIIRLTQDSYGVTSDRDAFLFPCGWRGSANGIEVLSQHYEMSVCVLQAVDLH